MCEGVQLKQYHPREHRACANESGGQTSFVQKTLRQSRTGTVTVAVQMVSMKRIRGWERRGARNITRRTHAQNIQHATSNRRLVGRSGGRGRTRGAPTQAAGDVPLISNNAALKLQNSESRIPLRKCEDVVSPNANRRQDKEGRSGEKNLGKRVVPT